MYIKLRNVCMIVVKQEWSRWKRMLQKFFFFKLIFLLNFFFLVFSIHGNKTAMWLTFQISAEIFCLFQWDQIFLQSIIEIEELFFCVTNSIDWKSIFVCLVNGRVLETETLFFKFCYDEGRKAKIKIMRGYP